MMPIIGTKSRRTGQAADKEISPTPDHPVQQVSWYDAVLFCNWLSRKERLTPCYERAARRQRSSVHRRKTG